MRKWLQVLVGKLNGFADVRIFRLTDSVIHLCFFRKAYYEFLFAIFDLIEPNF